MSTASSNELPRVSEAASREPEKSGAVASKHKEGIESVLALLFGVIFLGLSVVVSVETLARKLFNFSIQGADELGGYALALGSTLAFSLAVMGRAHIRVDVFHERFPKRLKAALNLVAIVSLAGFAIFICWLAYRVLLDTFEYGSTAPTPWGTPLALPQSLWLVGLIAFALVATGYAVQAIRLFLNGSTDRLLVDFSPKSAKEELKEELEDLAVRHGGETS
ncbi:TRAP transporter small permease [Pararhizobium sp. YC-54]|uniref:TRAP transporter small permease subunit n=1 Tax=Pararhizobium sp. YC-54 TaxID=2986920 RepID=UPI0021F75C98|nr:TRAP transporter small permease [Pararhizobium sp. YC-54]MCW0000594.1 TRAP transporter small permease [Pararhizobium sp. YC-54]